MRCNYANRACIQRCMMSHMEFYAFLWSSTALQYVNWKLARESFQAFKCHGTVILDGTVWKAIYLPKVIIKFAWNNISAADELLRILCCRFPKVSYLPDVCVVRYARSAENLWIFSAALAVKCAVKCAACWRMLSIYIAVETFQLYKAFILKLA